MTGTRASTLPRRGRWVPPSRPRRRRGAPGGRRKATAARDGLAPGCGPGGSRFESGRSPLTKPPLRRGFLDTDPNRERTQGTTGGTSSRESTTTVRPRRSRPPTAPRRGLALAVVLVTDEQVEQIAR